MGANEETELEKTIFQSNWPEGLSVRQLHRFVCDDCCPEESLRSLDVYIGVDGDVWLSIRKIDLNTNLSVRCRTYGGGGNHRRTHQALLWLARAIHLDNQELGVDYDMAK